MTPAIPTAGVLFQAAHDAGTVSGYRQALSQVAENLTRQAAAWRAEAETKRATAGFWTRLFARRRLCREREAAHQAAAAVDQVAAALLQQAQSREGEEQQRRDVAANVAGRLDAALEQKRPAPGEPSLLDLVLGHLTRRRA